MNLYAFNNKKSRKKIWEDLSKLKSFDNDAKWLFLGDFNVPLYEHEKKGGGNASQLEGRLDLMDFINKKGLMDLDLQGIDFT